MPSSDETRDAILDTAEALLARHGAGKTGVVDIARALGMSHANVYRYFANKADLFDAVAERWLARDAKPLYAVVTGGGDASDRLMRWILTIYSHKRQKVIDEPELFAFYKALMAESSRDFVAQHTQDLAAQLDKILEDGMASGTFKVNDRKRAIGIILDATSVLRHPAIVAGPTAPDEHRARALAMTIRDALRAGVF